MAAANAVLDVIEKEKLYTHVSEVSKFLLNELEKLKLKHEIIGDIRFVVVVWEINFSFQKTQCFFILRYRGYGYFIGIDFVKNRQTREPATESAYTILKT